MGTVVLLYFAGATTQSANPTTHEAPSGLYGRLPLAFEANHGQTDSQVQFLARGSGYQVFLARAEAVMAFRSPATEPRASGGVPTKTQKTPPTDDMKQAVVRMALEGANPDPHVMGLEQAPGKVNYLRGNDPDEWQTNVPTYAKVRYEAVYAGIDLVYYGHERQLEYDFIVAPGADPHAITLSFEGADSVDLDAGGALVLTTAAGPIRFHKPLIYQETDGRRESVAGEYVRKGTGRIGFRVGGYDIARALVIDPVLSYSTYLGGSALDAGLDIAVDGTGAAYVTGLTQSLDFPTRVPVQSTLNNGVDAFVAKLSPDGSGLVYATYLGGDNLDQGSNIAVDATGAAYIVGLTESRDFPIQSAVQPTLAGEEDGFVAKLTPDGTALIYATYLGGEDSDLARDIAVDAGGSAYVTGATCSSNFPTKSPLQPTLHGRCDAVVVKLAPDGVPVYSTYLGGSALEDGDGIAVDITGAAFVAGWTTSEDFPTRFPLQPLLNGGAASGQDEIGDAFIAKLAPDGTALLYGTYLGGTGQDAATSMAVDSAGAAYILGETQSQDFPTASPLQPRPARAASTGQTLSLFVAKLTANGSALAYSTYFGGTGTNATDIAVDPTGAAYVAGWVPAGFDFIVVHPIKPDRSETGIQEGFIAKFAPDGSGLLYSVTLDNGDYGETDGVAVDATGAAYVTGVTTSLTFATTNAFQPTIGGDLDGFVLKLAAASTDVPVRNVNGLVALPAGEVTTSFDPTPVSTLYPAGTFRIVAGFDNVSSFTICNPFFQVVELPLADRLQGVWIEPTDLQIQGPVAYPVNHPTVAFEPGARIRFRFDIRLSTTDAFPFFVNVWGTPQAPGTPCA